mmetsp:Transcript_5224/g.19524  ORF Transcript_5224/g.19524 Transcript_5224/m.19524 type:complete len:411 (-) Transcript_5224:321-1553(-)
MRPCRRRHRCAPCVQGRRRSRRRRTATKRPARPAPPNRRCPCTADCGRFSCWRSPQRAAQAEAIAVVAQPNRGQREEQGAAMQGGHRAQHAGLAIGHPGLRQHDELEVDDEAQQSKQQIPVAGTARAAGRQADAEQGHVDAAQDHAEAPGQFALVLGPGAAHQVQGRHRLGRQLAVARHGLAVGQHPVLLEPGEALVAGLELGFIALPVVQHEEAVLAFNLQPSAGRGGHRFPVVLNPEDEHIAARRGVVLSALDEEDPAAIARGLELAGRHARQVAALLVLVQQFGTVAIAPGPDDELQHDDREQHRPGHPQHRLHEARQRDATGEPDGHLGLPIQAAERQDDGDEQRQREDGRKRRQGGIAHQQHDVLGRNIAAGGLADVADQHRSQHDGQDDHQRDAEALGQLGPRR